MNFSPGDIIAILTTVAAVLRSLWMEAQHRQETKDWRKNVEARLERIERALERSRSF